MTGHVPSDAAKVYLRANPPYCSYEAQAFDAGYDAALATLQPRTITTEAERDALAVGSVLARFHTDGSGPSVFVRTSEGWLMATERASVLIYPDGRDEVGNRMAPLTLLAPVPAATPEPATCCDSVGEPFDHVIDSGWLCEVHTHHTCGSIDPHEPGCGLVPIVNLAELKGWPAATPEPVRITDPDDPRIRVGALVAVTFQPNKEEATTYRVRIVESGLRAKGLNHVRDCVRCDSEVILLAEAPDPDAEKRQAIAEVVGDLCGVDVTDGDCGEILTGLRERGVAK